jgi:hypothetical protein
MPTRQGPLRRIEQLRRELEAEGKVTTPEAEVPMPEPIWKSSNKLVGDSDRDWGQG